MRSSAELAGLAAINPAHSEQQPECGVGERGGGERVDELALAGIVHIMMSRAPASRFAVEWMNG
jgi:hypothetical protein